VVKGTTAVAFNSTIDSQASEANDLVVNSPSTTFAGIIGAAANGSLGLLQTNQAGTTTINITAVGNGIDAARLNFEDNVVIGHSVAVRGSTSVVFGGTIDSQSGGANDLTVNSPNTTFNGSIGAATGGALGLLSTNPNGGTVINSPEIHAAVIDFHDLITIGSSTVITATTSVDFAQTVFSEVGEFNNLTINSPAVTFHDLVGAGAAAAFGLLKTGAGGTTLIDTTAVVAKRMDFGNAVVLGQDLLLSASQSIVFRSTVNSQAGEANDLTLEAPITNFNGQVGNAGPNTQLGALTTDAAGTTTLDTAVIKADSVTFNDAVVLAFDLTITSPSVAFNAELDSRGTELHNLTINSPLTTFGGVVGGMGSLGTLTTDAAGTTTINSGAVTAQTLDFNDPVIIGVDTVLTGANGITFHSTLDSETGEANDLSLITGTGVSGATIRFMDAVGGAAGGALGALVVQTDGVTHLDGGTVTSASSEFRGAAVLGVTTTITADSSVTFTSTVDSEAGEGNGLTIAALRAIFQGSVGGMPGLPSTSTTALGSLTCNGNANLGSQAAAIQVTTLNDQFYNNAVGLAGDVTINTRSVTFGGTLDSVLGDHNLTVNTSSNGTTRFTSDVGQITPLASITTNNDGTTIIGASAVTTSGDQTYNDKVLLANDTAITSQNVLFADTLDSLSAAHNLSVLGAGVGNVTFASTVGSNLRLASLSVTSGGQTRLNGGMVTTSGGQTYNGATIIGADTVLSASGVTFGGTLNSDANHRSLTVNTTGNGVTNFNGDVGASSNLQSITTNADGRTQISARTIQTVADQNYNDAVLLGANVTLRGQAVRFMSTVDATPLLGPVGLTVNASGITRFNGVVGGVTPLLSITTDAAGQTRIGADMHTQGSMAFNDQVFVYADSVLSDTGATGIAFGSTLQSQSGNHALTLLVDPGSNATQSSTSIAKISFADNVGGDLSTTTGAFSSLTLGADRSTNPTVATIVAGLDGSGNPISNFGLTINTTGAFTMGARQKFTVIGDLTIKSGGPATLSDLNTLGNMTVTAPSIAIITRPGGPLLGVVPGNAFATVQDRQVDFIAGRSINFSVSPTLIGGFLGPAFATPQAAGISDTLRSFSNVSFGQDVTASIMHVGSTYADLRSEGPTITNVADAIAGAVPHTSQSGLVTQDTAVGRAQQQALQELGVYARDPAFKELVDFLSGRALYNDLPQTANPIAGDYQVTVNRLPYELVNQVLSSYHKVFYKDDQPNPQHAGQVLGAAWAEYSKAAGAKADPLGFRAYVEAVPAQAEALYYLDGLRQLFTELGYLGLSPVELKSARLTLLNAVAVPGLSPDQVEAAILARNLGPAGATQ
jgi:hypothetical protein